MNKNWDATQGKPSDETVKNLAEIYGFKESTIRILISTNGNVDHQVYRKLLDDDPAFASEYRDAIFSENPDLLTEELKSLGIDWNIDGEDIYNQIMRSIEKPT